MTIAADGPNILDYIAIMLKFDYFLLHICLENTDIATQMAMNVFSPAGVCYA